MHLIHVVPALARSSPPSQVEALQSRGHTVQAWRRSPTALAGLVSDAAVLVDAVQDSQAGQEYCRGLARIRLHAPVVVALAPQQLGGLGVEWCVDDVVVTTTTVLEWERRLLWALERRHRRAAGSLMQRFDDVTLDGEAFTLTVPGRVIALTQTEYRVLHLFFSNPEVTLTRPVIRAHGWTSTSNANRAVDIFICRLRHKLGSAGAALETVRGAGYRFVPPHLAAQRAA